MTYSNLLAAQARTELEMFYLLSVEEGVLLLSQCLSSGTPNNRPQTTKQDSKALQLGGGQITK